MGNMHDAIDDRLRLFIQAQHLFFVATAPLSAAGHVNVSPKGLDSLRVLGDRTVVYLDHVGSGAETIAHLKENGRIVLMLCSFAGAPRIVRLHGEGEVLEPGHRDYAALRALFAAEPAGRAIIRIAVHRIAESCGHGVPLFSYEGDRPQLAAWAARKGEAGLAAYQRENNAVSIDGLPALAPK
jgi:hypothetical protein